MHFVTFYSCRGNFVPGIRDPCLVSSLELKITIYVKITIYRVCFNCPFPTLSVYSASKAALRTLSEGMREELSYFDVDVVLLNPGEIKYLLRSKLISVLKPVKPSKSRTF